MARKCSRLKDLYATLFFAGNARFDFTGCIMDCEVHFK